MNNLGNHISPFQQLIAHECDAALHNTPLSELIPRLLSFGGKLDERSSRLALDEFETELVNALEETEELFLSAQPVESDSVANIRVSYNVHGKLRLRPVWEPVPTHHRGGRELGYIPLPKPAFTLVQAAAQMQVVEEEKVRARFTRLLEEREHRGELGELLDQVEDSVTHVEAVAIYIDEQLWSVMEGCSTLIDRDGEPGILTRLRAKPLAEWTSTEKFGVVALRALFLSGRSVRFEEFNGAQLNAIRLLSRFAELELEYAKRLGEPCGGSGRDLFAWAKDVRAASARSVGKPWLRYRKINGITYAKAERITYAVVPGDVASIPEELVELYPQWTGTYYDARLSWREFFQSLATAALQGADIERRDTKTASNAVEHLMETIVASAVVRVGADYGMSSSLRDLTPLLVKDPDILEEVHRLTPKNFFTCVVARPGLDTEFGPSFQKHVFAAIQKRMQFNRWHFIAGNFPEHSVSPGRHYFYPPLIPDIAEWSDLRHGGHTKARVRFSVRAPGPDMGLEPLRIGTRDYRGFYDVRVARQDGPPFTVAEMVEVRNHCLWLGEVWRAIAQHCAGGGSFKVEGFKAGNGLCMSEAHARQLRHRLSPFSWNASTGSDARH